MRHDAWASYLAASCLIPHAPGGLESPLPQHLDRCSVFECALAGHDYLFSRLEAGECFDVIAFFDAEGDVAAFGGAVVGDEYVRLTQLADDCLARDADRVLLCIADDAHRHECAGTD